MSAMFDPFQTSTTSSSKANHASMATSPSTSTTIESSSSSLFANTHPEALATSPFQNKDTPSTATSATLDNKNDNKNSSNNNDNVTKNEAIVADFHNEKTTIDSRDGVYVLRTRRGSVYYGPVHKNMMMPPSDFSFDNDDSAYFGHDANHPGGSVAKKDASNSASKACEDFDFFGIKADRKNDPAETAGANAPQPPPPPPSMSPHRPPDSGRTSKPLNKKKNITETSGSRNSPKQSPPRDESPFTAEQRHAIAATVYQERKERKRQQRRDSGSSLHSASNHSTTTHETSTSKQQRRRPPQQQRRRHSDDGISIASTVSVMDQSVFSASSSASQRRRRQAPRGKSASPITSPGSVSASVTSTATPSEKDNQSATKRRGRKERRNSSNAIAQRSRSPASPPSTPKGSLAKRLHEQRSKSYSPSARPRKSRSTASKNASQNTSSFRKRANNNASPNLNGGSKSSASRKKGLALQPPHSPTVLDDEKISDDASKCTAATYTSCSTSSAPEKNSNASVSTLSMWTPRAPEHRISVKFMASGSINYKNGPDTRDTQTQWSTHSSSPELESIAQHRDPTRRESNTRNADVIPVISKSRYAHPPKTNRRRASSTDSISPNSKRKSLSAMIQSENLDKDDFDEFDQNPDNVTLGSISLCGATETLTKAILSKPGVGSPGQRKSVTTISYGSRASNACHVEIPSVLKAAGTSPNATFRKANPSRLKQQDLKKGGVKRNNSPASLASASPTSSPRAQPRPTSHRARRIKEQQEESSGRRARSAEGLRRKRTRKLKTCGSSKSDVDTDDEQDPTTVVSPKQVENVEELLWSDVESDGEELNTVKDNKLATKVNNPTASPLASNLATLEGKFMDRKTKEMILSQQGKVEVGADGKARLVFELGDVSAI